MLRKAILALVIFDNYLSNLPKRFLFRPQWQLAGSCRKCGRCCQEIYVRATERQLASGWFIDLTIRWISWLFNFIHLRTEAERGYLVFTCRSKLADGRCGDYFWRPNICRNYPLVDYFDRPTVFPDCGFKA
jgi:hypothetical protein